MDTNALLQKAPLGKVRTKPLFHHAATRSATLGPGRCKVWPFFSLCAVRLPLAAHSVQPKKVLFNSPSGEMVFGVPGRTGLEESARDVTMTWKEHTPNPNSRPGREEILKHARETIYPPGRSGFPSLTFLLPRPRLPRHEQAG